MKTFEEMTKEKKLADMFDVLDLWKFVILKDDGTSVDVTDNTEDAFAMMTKPLDDLFYIYFERLGIINDIRLETVSVL